MRPRFFATAAEFRAWLGRHHASAAELWVGMYKAGSGKRGITYPEALDEALCFGWIDGVRKRLDAAAFVQRFSPRKAKSSWSAVNTKRALELERARRMHPAGRAAFDRRDASATARYSLERAAAALTPAEEKRFRANRKAWSYFDREAPWYRRVTVHWVTSAKRDETRKRRLDRLIADSAAGRRIGLFPKR